MDASRSRLCLYDAAREAIRDASAGGAAAEAVGRDQDACVATRPQHDDVLDKKLHRSVEEMYHSTRGQQNSSTQGTPDVQLSASDSGVGNKKRQRHDGEEAPTEDAGDASDGEEGHPTTQEDECLGLMAEAFADDLDLLRKDDHFGGSANDIAAMADMMRYFPASACGRCV
ncbi:expressed unknown protein [Ectocarpus siliculosus]|uniref:Uncharacterized protein n=1 Tax=Ectocarpus siliculosus TaxID=2880 RepID=D8LNF4_ECTSI|nr:expressed unknown protein [Ectocarpus siliculosus]|eukprot:CBN77311.1 expressed unknown protein [Ectocarpus siliculosus]